MANAAYIVLAYKFDNLVELLAEKSNREFVLDKTHSVYFEGYFDALQAKTIVVEENYIDHDYLDDFTAYYVKCFHSYPRHTRRLHFFSAPFDGIKFAAVLRGEDSETLKSLKSGYLGFVVVKPLPQTLVGRTCLTTYPSENGRRQFPSLQDYAANLFGIDLIVKTLAFQEQDSVVAACATSALWSAFQGTGQIFHHWIPSPAEITRIAANHIPEEHPQGLPQTRGMPNKGLTATQMAHAIRGVGLEPYLVGSSNLTLLRATAYAYLRARIPMILVFALEEVFGNGAPCAFIGRHGVAITGYSLGDDQPTLIENTKVNLKACRIDKLYVHDDQVGPFARMGFLPNGRLDTSWFVRQNRTVQASPQFLLIPLYNKIRIPYGSILDAMIDLGAVIDLLIAQVMTAGAWVTEWDIYLITVNDYKSEVLNSTTLKSDAREEILSRNLPKYLWRATVLLDDKMELDFLFDATDIEQRGAFICTVEYQSNITSLLQFLAKSSQTIPMGPMVKSVIASFR